MTTTNEPHVPPQVSKRTPHQSNFCVGVMLAALALSCTAQPFEKTSPPPAVPSTKQPTPANTPTTAPIAARLQRLYPATHFGVVNATCQLALKLLQTDRTTDPAGEGIFSEWSEFSGKKYDATTPDTVAADLVLAVHTYRNAPQDLAAFISRKRNLLLRHFERRTVEVEGLGG